MSDAPERMWARKSISGNCVVSFSTPSEEYCIEYVRADLHHSLALDVVAAGGQASDAYAAQLKAEAMAAKLADGVRDFRRIMSDSIVEKDGPHTVTLEDGTICSGPVVDFLHKLVGLQIQMVDKILAEYEASK